MSTPWTEADIVLLKSLWASDELSARGMAEKFPGKTRSSILGKAHRLQLKSKKLFGKPQKAHVRKTVPIDYRFYREKPAGVIDKAKPPNMGSLVPFSDLKRNNCRYIIDTKNSLFCSNKAEIGVSWCDYHKLIVFQPPRPR